MAGQTRVACEQELVLACVSNQLEKPPSEPSIPVVWQKEIHGGGGSVVWPDLGFENVFLRPLRNCRKNLGVAPNGTQYEPFGDKPDRGPSTQLVAHGFGSTCYSNWKTIQTHCTGGVSGGVRQTFY